MKELIRRAKNRDPDAFSELILDMTENMYKTARSILSNDEDAADAMSEAVLTCWERMGQLKEERFFRTWLTKILVNKCYDILRKKEKLFFTDQMPEVEITEKGYENLEWEQALGALEEHYRVVVMLYYGQGFKTSEIAEILQIPEATVRTRLARARGKAAEIYQWKPERRKTI